jgi:hypothetical protein
MRGKPRRIDAQVGAADAQNEIRSGSGIAAADLFGNLVDPNA